MRAHVVANPRFSNGALRATKTIVRGQVIRGKVARKRRANGRRYANAPVVLMSSNPRRRRRSNAPLIIPSAANPRRRRRANGMFGGFNLRRFGEQALTGGLAAGGAYLLNKMFISGLLATGETATSAPTIGGLAMRGAARLVAGALGMAVWPAGGAAFLAANLYPLMAEIDQYMHPAAANPSFAMDYEADLRQAV